MEKATWVNGKKKVTGYWTYIWASDRFFISLNSKDGITGIRREFVVSGDPPEWGNWKRVKEQK